MGVLQTRSPGDQSIPFVACQSSMQQIAAKIYLIDLNVGIVQIAGMGIASASFSIKYNMPVEFCMQSLNYIGSEFQ